jgi:hypothetical protein
VERGASLADREKAPVTDLWRTFLASFFKLPRSWLAPGGLLGYSHGYGAAGLPGGAAGLHQIGDALDTPFGRGVAVNVRVSACAVMYEVWLPFCARAYLNATCLKAATSGGAGGGGGGGGGGGAPAAPAPAGKGAKAAAAAAAAATATAAAAAAAPSPLPPPLSAFAGAKWKATARGTVDLGAVPGGATVGDVHYILPGDAAGPLPAAATARPAPTQLFFGSATSYVFFRLHQMLVDRLVTARILCAKAKGRDERALGGKGGAGASASAPASAAAPAGAPPLRPAGVLLPAAAAAAAAGAHESGRAHAASALSTAALAASSGDLAAAVSASLGGGEDSARADAGYQNFLTALFGVLDGSIDTSRYESDCAELMGTSAYLLYTMDKLAQNAAKQLVAVR